MQPLTIALGNYGLTKPIKQAGTDLGRLNLKFVEVEQTGIDQSGAEHAEDAYCQALALATELGMRPLVAHCHFGLGKLCEQTSKREQAREHVTTAITMYREMDMQFWLEKAGDSLSSLSGA